MDAHEAAFNENFWSIFQAGERRAWMRGSRDPEDQAQVAASRAWLESEKRGGDPEWIGAATARAFAAMVAGNQSVDDHRGGERRKKAEREHSVVHRSEATTDEVDAAVIDRMRPRPERSVIPVLLGLSESCVEHRDPQCPVCLAQGMASCPDSERVVSVASAFFRAPLLSTSTAVNRKRVLLPDGTQKRDYFTDEVSLRCAAVDCGLSDLSVLNAARGAAAAYYRGVGLHSAFLVHSEAARLGRLGRGTVVLVRDTAHATKTRLGRTWSPLQEREIAEWCDDMRVAWPKPKGDQGKRAA